MDQTKMGKVGRGISRDLVSGGSGGEEMKPKYKNPGHPKDKCANCKKQVGKCKCDKPNHPMGCEYTRCGRVLSPWDL
jgi:hypothetical protein